MNITPNNGGTMLERFAWNPFYWDLYSPPGTPSMHRARINFEPIGKDQDRFTQAMNRSYDFAQQEF